MSVATFGSEQLAAKLRTAHIDSFQLTRSVVFVGSTAVVNRVAQAMSHKANGVLRLWVSTVHNLNSTLPHIRIVVKTNELVLRRTRYPEIYIIVFCISFQIALYHVLLSWLNEISITLSVSIIILNNTNVALHCGIK